MSETGRALEDFVKTIAMVSRDIAMLVEEFRDLFRYDDAIAYDEFDDRTKIFWKRLESVARVLRSGIGVTLDRLLIANTLTASEARQCIRIMINLGGEIEVTTDPAGKEQVFILHN